MNPKFFIKNVVLILKKQEIEARAEMPSRFQPLIEKLKAEGISLCLWDDVCVAGKKPAEPLAATPPETLRGLPEMSANDTLYITDCSWAAGLLKERELPVLGYQHENGESLAGMEYVMECPEELEVSYLDRVYRRFCGIPWDILETERCVLRESTVEDVDAFYKIYGHPEIVRYTEALHADRKQEIDYIREYIEKVYKYFEFGIWTVIRKETGEIIGRAGFAVREGYELPELGFVIAVPWQGKGVAYEICRAILNYGREEFAFDRVQAFVMPENKASLSLCRKLGFVEDKRVQEKGREYQLLIYNLFKP